MLRTAGYVPRLDRYLGPETPNPLLIRRQRGDCAFDTILRDVMGHRALRPVGGARVHPQLAAEFNRGAHNIHRMSEWVIGRHHDVGKAPPRSDAK
jgi:hypothetical protein